MSENIWPILSNLINHLYGLKRSLTFFKHWEMNMSILAKLTTVQISPTSQWFTTTKVYFSLKQYAHHVSSMGGPAAWIHVFSLTPWLKKQPSCGTSPVLWQMENILWSTCQFFELPFRNDTILSSQIFIFDQTMTLPTTT